MTPESKSKAGKKAKELKWWAIINSKTEEIITVCSKEYVLKETSKLFEGYSVIPVLITPL